MPSTSNADARAAADGAESDPLSALEAARERHREAEAAVEEVGAERLTRLRDVVGRADRLLDGYEDSATGTGDFEAYLEFQGEFSTLVDDLPEEFPAREAFERANDAVDGRRLSESDFAAAREALDPARDLAGRLEEVNDAERAVYDAERAVETRLSNLDDRVDRLARLEALGDADLDAPTEEVREPVADYDEAVREAFASFRESASAREFFDFLDDTAHFPLVEFEPSPAELREYLREHDAGEESVPTLLAYADYSTSKLDHYVDDAGAFRARIPVHRTYLDRLSAEPLTVGWPPPPAGELRALAGELVSVVARFADEATVARARTLKRVAGRDDYERLRRAAEAEAELSADERERLASGAVAADLADAREERERLREALDAGRTTG
ncbi:DUF7118 family protein [Candidatus Halobonum tyrrellensis]|uniref:Uncharacterized protein n=1 Tax=Candidatus Halobonum tyrrellensis G22 TaxID=1324957 RepID=V4GRQ9_9EURY|nr:hypothetical protein [Candidatus Halobonum tyrrellensis]ESP87741.1 hypothetical protein K933_12488 [Candidatus Halobonum tyrrellensis G22]